MHPNYHIHQSSKRVTIRDENARVAPSVPSHVKPIAPFRNSCDTANTANTFFTLLSGSSRESLGGNYPDPTPKETNNLLSHSKDIKSLLNNISSLNSKLQEAKSSLTSGPKKQAKLTPSRKENVKRES